jgi:hypothetical protein
LLENIALSLLLAFFFGGVFCCGGDIDDAKRYGPITESQYYQNWEKLKQNIAITCCCGHSIFAAWSLALYCHCWCWWC